VSFGCRGDAGQQLCQLVVDQAALVTNVWLLVLQHFYHNVAPGCSTRPRFVRSFGTSEINQVKLALLKVALALLPQGEDHSSVRAAGPIVATDFHVHLRSCGRAVLEDGLHDTAQVIDFFDLHLGRLSRACLGNGHGHIFFEQVEAAHQVEFEASDKKLEFGPG